MTQRHATKASIAAHAPTLVPAANEAVSAIQDLDVLKIQQVKLLDASDEQIAVLHGVMLEWSSHLARDMRGFDLGLFTRDANHSLDVLKKAESLKQVVEEAGVELPYQGTLLAELTARIDGANEARSSAQTARVALQEKQREVRELIVRFHKELVSLRRTVRAALGSSHIDYQRLRVPLRAAADEPEGAEAPVTEPSAPETDRSSDA